MTIVLFLLSGGSVPAADENSGNDDGPGLSQLTAYPRIERYEEGSVRVDFPSLESWPDFRALKAWLPVEVTLEGEPRASVGSALVQALTTIDFDQRTVTISGPEVLESRFSGSAPSSVRDQLVSRAFSGRENIVPLDVLLRLLPEDFEIPGQGMDNTGLNFSPPRIVVSEMPLKLLLIDREPVKAPIPGLDLEYVVNTDWDVFYYPPNARWYVLNENTWQQNNYLADGGWESVDRLPRDFDKLALTERWQAVAGALPARMPADPPAPFVIGLAETELILLDGAPRLAGIAETGIHYVSNTQSDLFRYADKWYFLVSGRWFVADELGGLWRNALDVPDAFGQIPAGHEKGHVLFSVPGTRQAKLALIEAALPHRNAVATGSGGDVRVSWIGQPDFTAIEGTGLQRGLNTPYQVIRHNNFYYLCYEGAWYFSPSPTGAWKVAQRIPDEIYRIPPSDPAYNVTFVRLDTTSPATPDRVNFYFTGGYTGSFSTRVNVVYGTGWYYPSAVYWDPVTGPAYWRNVRTYGYNTVYYPVGAHYGPRYPYGGWWGAYGPYAGWGYGGVTTITVDSPAVEFRQGPGSAWEGPLQTRPGYPSSRDDKPLEAFLPRKEADGTEKFTDTREDDTAKPADVTASSLYAGTILSSNRFSGPDGDVYRSEDQQWSQYAEGGWTTMQDIAGQQPVRREPGEATVIETQQGWIPARKRSLSRSELDRQALARIEGMDQYSKYVMAKEASKK